MMRHAFTGLLLALCFANAAATEPLEVQATNASTATLCAESDNVDLRLHSPEVRRFTVEATHPAYAGTIAVDRWAPDFSNCDMGGDPAFKFDRRRLTIYETEEWQLVGITFADFWRPDRVPVRVGNRVETGFHLLQLWTRHQERAEEVLVLYPADGYWRARPLPPANLRWSAYGSSFMVGPVEESGRPIVDIGEIEFDPATRTFTLRFKRGGQASVRLDKLDNERIVLDVALSGAMPPAIPFLALRSMFVTETNADVAWVGWLGQDRKAWQQAPVMTFGGAGVTELWAGRQVPSRHNTSAPDMMFRDFRATR